MMTIDCFDHGPLSDYGDDTEAGRVAAGFIALAKQARGEYVSYTEVGQIEMAKDALAALHEIEPTLENAEQTITDLRRRAEAAEASRDRWIQRARRMRGLYKVTRDDLEEARQLLALCSPLVSGGGLDYCHPEEWPDGQSLCDRIDAFVAAGRPES